MSGSYWWKGEISGEERSTKKPEALAPALDTLTVTGGSTMKVFVVAVEAVKSGAWACETPKDTSEKGAMVIGWRLWMWVKEQKNLEKIHLLLE